MSKELGPGTRVWIGWAPSEKRHGPSAQSAPGKTGTVRKFLFAPGSLLKLGSDFAITGENIWLVDRDDGQETEVGETLLFPIDGGEPVEQTDKQEEKA